MAVGGGVGVGSGVAVGAAIIAVRVARTSSIGSVGVGCGVGVGAARVSSATIIAFNLASLSGCAPSVAGGAVAARPSKEQLIPPKAKSHIAMPAMPSAGSRKDIARRPRRPEPGFSGL